MTAALRRIAIIISALCLLPGCANNTDRLACSICGETGLEVDQISHEHGVGVCALQARCRNKGHYILMGETGDQHAQCGICQGWLCSGSHGQGTCQPPATPEPTTEPTPRPTLEPTPEPIPELTPTPEPEETPEPTARPTPAPETTPTPLPTATPEPAPTPLPTATPQPMPQLPTPSPVPGAGPTGEPDSSADGDWTLEDFYVTMEDGTVYGLSRPEKRTVTCSGASYATVTATPRSSTATVTGDVGRVSLKPGENHFRVTVTARSGEYESFNFTIINK